MAGRPQIFDEKEVLEKATALFWSKGYEATSMDDLLQAMGMGKSSFYHAFESKKALFERVLDRYANDAVDQLRKDLETAPHPLERIREFFRSIAVSAPSLHMKGCFMGNTVVELTNTEKALKSRAAKRLEQLEQMFFKYLTIARKQGDLHSQEDPAVIARYLLTCWNGLNVTRRIFPDPEALGPLIELQLTIIKKNDPGPPLKFTL